MRSLADIDAEIVQARDELIALRRQRNYLSATQRLPPEVLVRILRLADSDKTWHVAYGDYKVTRPLTWMGILHVCSRWREICMNFSGYWTSVPTWNIRWMQLALARSGVAPIDLYYGGNDDEYSLSSTAALEHLPRVRNLRIEHPKFHERDTWFLPLLKKHPAPLLEHFEFGPTGPRIQWSRLDYLHGHFLDLANTPLFQDVIPHLRVLVLWQVRIGPDSTLLTSTLRRLTLSCVPRQWRWTYPQLQDVLRRLPQLKDLRLLNALPLATTSTTTTHVSPLELPSLAHLSLDIERCQEAHDFFTHFVVPTTAFVDVDSQCTHPYIEEILEGLEDEDVYPHLPEDTAPPHQRLIEALRLYTHGVGSDTLRDGMQPVRHLHAEASYTGLRLALDGSPCTDVEFDCDKGIDYDPPPWDEKPEYYFPRLVMDSYSPGPHPVNPEPRSAKVGPQLAISVPWLVAELATELSDAAMDEDVACDAQPEDNPLAHALGVVAASLGALDDLETMTIAGDCTAIPLVVWRRHFSNCSRLYKICILGDAGVAALLCALMRGDASGRPLFPALSLLAISEVDLREESLGLETLKLLLRRRGIARVEISWCQVDAHTIDILRQSTDSEVSWDRRKEASQIKYMLGAT